MADIDWPEYDVPADALLPDAERTPAQPETPPVTPPAAATPPPTSPPAAAPAVGAHGTTEPPPARTSDDGSTVPKYRLDETIEARNAAVRRAEQAEAELQRLRSQPPPVARPVATTPPVAATPPVADPANDAVRARLEELYPELKHLKSAAALAQRSGDIDEATDAIRQYRTAETRFYDRHTETQIGSLHTLAAEHVLGAGKGATDLPEMVRQTITQQFASWVAADPARSQRYNDLDTKLVGEFWPIFRAAMYDPVRRAESAAAITTATNRPPLPVGGSQAAPLAGAPPKPASPEDEDAIHSRAWQGVVTSRG